MKNCDLGLKNAALGLRPRAAFSRPRSQFFTIRTSQPANNIYSSDLLFDYGDIRSSNFIILFITSNIPAIFPNIQSFNANVIFGTCHFQYAILQFKHLNFERKHAVHRPGNEVAYGCISLFIKYYMKMRKRLPKVGM